MQIVFTVALWSMSSGCVAAACSPDDNGGKASARAAEPSAQTNAPDQDKFWSKTARSIAKKRGWLENYRRGKRILRELSTLDADGKKKLEIGAYRGERVAFLGDAAPAGGTNDLLTERGFYLRVVNAERKDLRPVATGWVVLVCGEVQQVILENKIIVLQVAEKDWQLLMSY